MDDIFQILIYIIIAISFISSFFKKKKPVPPPSEVSSTQEAQLESNRTGSSSQPMTKTKEGSDFLKELEGFFNVGDQFTPPKEKTELPVHDDKDIYEGAEKRDNYIKVPEKSFHEKTSSEHTFIDPWDVKQKEMEKKKKAITSEIEKKASLYKKNIEQSNKEANTIVHNIRDRIKQPASLREYIVISELIGKPKAYKG